MALVRALTEDGRNGFRRWLEAGATGVPPRHLLTESGMSQAIKASAVVDDRPFASRLDCGRHLVDRLGGLPVASLRFEEGLWDWLSLFYVEQLIPLQADGPRKPLKPWHYLLELKRLWSRHLIRMNWMTVREHGEEAKLVLSGPMHVHPDILEQIAGQQETFGSTSAFGVAAALYWDELAGRPKVGAATRNKPARVRRLNAMFRQLRRTWDPDMMSVPQLLNLLPAEFAGWKPASVRPTTASIVAAEAHPEF